MLGESQNCEPGVAIHYTLALCYWAGHFTHHFSKRCLNNACCLEVGHHFLGARATVSTNKHRGKALQHGRACAQGMPAQNLTCMILYSVSRGGRLLGFGMRPPPLPSLQAHLVAKGQ